MPPAPADEYRLRLDQRRDAHAHLSRLDARFAAARLAIFALAVLLAVLGWLGVASYWWLALPLVAFAVLIQRHDRTIRARDAAARAITFYERGIARIEDRWIGTGEPGDRFLDEHHLYAHDLDLFGRGSLFELLSIARTRAGEETLAAWLKTPAAPQEIAARQHAVTELTGSLDLREALSLAGTDVRAGVHTQEIVQWAEGPPLLSPPWVRWATLAATAIVVLGALVWWRTGDYSLFLLVLAAQTIYGATNRKAVERALHAADGPARDLDILAHLLQRLEREQFVSPRLVALRRALDTERIPASKAIRSLYRLVEMHDWQHNLMFAPIGAALMWGTHIAWAIESWRRVHGHHVRVWLAAVGELEAFSSLSAYRFEHPDDPFPEIDLTTGSTGRPIALFDGIGLGHPLVPSARMVRNDVRFVGATQLCVVSGSNMSGKSTLLRTVGINAVLALAGAPVRVVSLRVSPLAIGATLRIQDSLQEGRSRFYAEITRIRELADVAAGPVPLLFLLDELLHGTNSHDRLIGASGVLRSLLGRGSIGLITTHDLALTAVANELAPRAANVHFEDWFEGNEIRFDYRLKPGPVTRSNAVALMRAVGLEVPDP